MEIRKQSLGRRDFDFQERKEENESYLISPLKWNANTAGKKLPSR